MNKSSSAVASEMSKKSIAIALSALIGFMSVPISGVSAAETNVKGAKTATVQNDKKESKSTTWKILAGFGAGAAILAAVGYYLTRSAPESKPVPSPAPESSSPAPLLSPTSLVILALHASPLITSVRMGKPLEDMNKEELLDELPVLWENFDKLRFNARKISDVIQDSNAAGTFESSEAVAEDIISHVGRARCSVIAEVNAIDKVGNEEALNSAKAARESSDSRLSRDPGLDSLSREQACAEAYAKTFAGHWKKGMRLYNAVKDKNRDEILHLAKVLEEQKTVICKVLIKYLPQ